jgi:hypothetical protein
MSHEGWLRPVVLAGTLIDTGLKIAVPAARLRNLQAVASIVSVGAMYFALSAATRGRNSLFLNAAQTFPEWPTWLPPGLVVRALVNPTALSEMGS